MTVSRLALGGAPLGGQLHPPGDETADAIVRRAYALGLRHFDTAPLYGAGTSERRMGHGLAHLPRDEIVLATKVGRLLRPAPPPDDAASGPASGGSRDATAAGEGRGALRPVFDFSYDGVMRSVEESLQRLGLDRVDVLHIHDADKH
ncbi:MAG: aldo/keto reductase [Chloroflexota bacterium]